MSSTLAQRDAYSLMSHEHAEAAGAGHPICTEANQFGCCAECGVSLDEICPLCGCAGYHVTGCEEAEDYEPPRPCVCGEEQGAHEPVIEPHAGRCELKGCGCSAYRPRRTSHRVDQRADYWRVVSNDYRIETLHFFETESAAWQFANEEADRLKLREVNALPGCPERSSVTIWHEFGYTLH
jgi:hypothetical protein